MEKSSMKTNVQGSVLSPKEETVKKGGATRGGSSSSTTTKSKGKEGEGHRDVRALTTLLQLEALARGALSVKELQFLAVNETRRLIPYRQAFFFSVAANHQMSCRVEAASSLAVVERDSPSVQWLERALKVMWIEEMKGSTVKFSEADCPNEVKAEWKEFSLPHVLWCPLKLMDQTVLGGIWLARDTPWQEGEMGFVQRLADTYAHAWGALAGTKKATRRIGVPSRWGWPALLLAGAVMFIPVPLSTLAPVEVIGKEPAVVSAPMDGVIAQIVVPPNTFVSEGQHIFTFEDTNYRNQFEVAEKKLAVAMAEIRKASQAAFTDDESLAQVPLLREVAKLREAERDYARELLDQVKVEAPRSGLLLYSDPSDWIGRPVVVGERIMEIASPERVELRIDLPIEDAIALKKGADVKVFLDAEPLETRAATVIHASYHAEVLPGNVLAYRVTAQLNDPHPDVRIGWQGTAKIYNEKVSLFFLLFRRPLATLRQFIGL